MESLSIAEHQVALEKQQVERCSHIEKLIPTVMGYIHKCERLKRRKQTIHSRVPRKFWTLDLKTLFREVIVIIVTAVVARFRTEKAQKVFTDDTPMLELVHWNQDTDGDALKLAILQKGPNVLVFSLPLLMYYYSVLTMHLGGSLQKRWSSSNMEHSNIISNDKQ